MDANDELRTWTALSALTGHSIPHLMALQAGAKIVTLPEAFGGMLHIKLERIARLEPRGVRTAVFFTPGGDDRPVLIDMEMDRVRRRINEALGGADG